MGLHSYNRIFVQTQSNGFTSTHVRDGGAGISSLLSFRNRYTVQPKPRHNQPILVGIFAQGALDSLYIIALIIFHD